MKFPIRILQVVGSMDMGGTETMLMNLYRCIDKAKIQFDFMVHTANEGYYDDEIKKLGGRIYRVPKFIGINLLVYKQEWKLFFNKHSEHIIIHGHIGSSAAIYLSIANKYDRFSIAHSHSNDLKKRNIKDVSYCFFSYFTRYIADFFFACSKEAALNRYGIKVTKSENFNCLNNAIDVKKYIFNEQLRTSMRADLHLEGKFVVGHVGRFNTVKNHGFLLDIFKIIHDKNKDVVLLLVGDGELHTEIEAKIKKLELTETVFFTGVRSDVHELLQTMDVFLFPSLFEGLGIVLIEAQAAGLKCFASADVVPSEAKVTDLLTYISLKQSAEYWANEVLKCSHGYERRNTLEEICRAGYDIHDTAKWLEDFYLNKQRMYIRQSFS